jgi:5,10-methylenetetrahydromethanopterin reductase
MSDLSSSIALEQIGICIFPDVSARQVMDVAMHADQLGLGFVGVGDVHELWADSYVSLALAAIATDRIKIGPWVTNSVTRHPTVTANAVTTLNDLSNGRALLGLGVGDGAVRLMGLQPATIGQLTEAIGVIRRKLQNGRDTSKATIPPIYWAAAGDRSTHEGARVADGVIVSGWITDELLRHSIHTIHQGASGRSLQPVRIFNTALAIDDDGAAAVAAARAYVARSLARPSSVRVPGWSEADFDRFRRGYDFRRHFRADQELAELVPNELVRKKAIVGTPSDCAALLQQVFAAGFERVALVPLGEPKRVLTRLVDDVIPLMRGTS